MAHLWIEDNINEWQILPLPAGSLIILPEYPAQSLRIGQGGELEESVAVLQALHADGSQWVLITRQGGCRINGEPIDLNIRVLRDKDEIQAANGPRHFFSTEMLPQIIPFKGAAQKVLCPRCQLEIAPGQPAVRCDCGVTYHQDASEELLCWTYGPCAFCGRPGSLDDGYRWTPEEL